MALSTSLANKTQSGGVIYKTNVDGGRVERHKANGDDIFLTAIVTSYGETGPDVDLCATGEAVLGVVIGTYVPYSVDLTKDSDDPFDDNQELQVYIPNDGDWLYGTVLVATTIVINTWVDVNGGFLIAGSRTAHIGIAREAVTAISGTTALILYQWDKGL